MKSRKANASLVCAVCLWLLTLQPAHSFYNATAGRWLSRDPVGEGDSANLYGFVRNSLPNKTDRLGLCTTCLVASQDGQPAQNGTATGSQNAPLCKSQLNFVFSQPQPYYDWQSISRKCNGSAACAIPNISFQTECKQCGCNWKIVAAVQGSCDIFYADPTVVPIIYDPSFDAIMNHEDCHCNDYFRALQDMLTLYDDVTYPNQARCEAARATYDHNFMSRFGERIRPSLNHSYGKYKENGECYATFRFM